MKEFWESIKLAYTEDGVITWAATLVVIVAVIAAIWIIRDKD